MFMSSGWVGELVGLTSVTYQYHNLRIFASCKYSKTLRVGCHVLSVKLLLLCFALFCICFVLLSGHDFSNLVGEM